MPFSFLFLTSHQRSATNGENGQVLQTKSSQENIESETGCRLGINYQHDGASVVTVAEQRAGRYVVTNAS